MVSAAVNVHSALSVRPMRQEMSRMANWGWALLGSPIGMNFTSPV